MVLVDSSAWVEFLRATGSPIDSKLTQLVEKEAELATSEPVIMELLAGAQSPTQVRALRARLLAFPVLRVEGLTDYEEAADLFRMCRRSGRTIRSLIDCLISSVALRNDASVLHADSDFDLIAEVTGLRIEPSV